MIRIGFTRNEENLMNPSIYTPLPHSLFSFPSSSSSSAAVAVADMDGTLVCLLNNGGLPTGGNGMPAKRSGHGKWSGHRKLARKPETSAGRLLVSAVMTRQKEDILEKLRSTWPVTTEAPIKTTMTTTYNDNWFHRLAIHHLSQSVQAATGVRNNKTGYEGLVEAAAVVGGFLNAQGQQELIIQALDRAFPKPILSLIRTILPPSKFTREYFALFTTVFFSWLVGSCQVKESKFEGRTERNVVYIKKCRLLESTSCVGMCTNMCKGPCQKFIKDSLGMPVNMVPNFEDMSCEMKFGQHPPPEADDPAFSQPCFQRLCKVKHLQGVDCSGK